MEILIGIISGVISGVGMGGGTILIFLLSFLCGLDQHIAQATNLIFFIPTSIVAIIVNIKQKKADIPLAIIVSVSGVIASLFGAKISVGTDVSTLKKLFGIFLAVIALHEIYSLIKQYRNYKKSHNNN